MPKTGFNPRKIMEQAIVVMNRSIHEIREDGKASPMVGAILYMPDGTIETAYRGELRDGDHAEFTFNLGLVFGGWIKTACASQLSQNWLLTGIKRCYPFI